MKKKVFIIIIVIFIALLPGKDYAENKIEIGILRQPTTGNDLSIIVNNAFFDAFKTIENFSISEIFISADQANAIYKNNNSIDTEAIPKHAKGQKIIAYSIKQEGENFIIHGWILNAQNKTIEYATTETARNKDEIKDASTAAAMRISFKLKGILDEITALKAGDGDSTEFIMLSWTSSKKSQKYHIFRATSETGDFKEIGASDTPGFNDADGLPGIKYWYKVKGSTLGIYTDFSPIDAGYRKISPPQGLDMNMLIKEKNLPPAKFGNAAEEQKSKNEQHILKPFYIHPVQLNLILFISRSYINDGQFIILRDFESYTLNEENKELTLISINNSYIIHLQSKRLFKIYKAAGPDLFDRLLKNALFFCSYNGNKEINRDDGTIYVLPYFEAIGMSAEYQRNSIQWQDQTILINTDNKEYKDKIKKAGGAHE
jgi:hypothetical protein